MKIAITSHRPNKLDNDYNLTSPLVLAIKDKITEILHRGYIFDKSEEVTLITGMALGIDTLFALIAIEFNIPFIAAIPFKGQEARWPRESKLKYYDILLRAKYIYLVDEDRYPSWKEFEVYTIDPTRYSADKMQKRNIWMVDQLTEPGDTLISVWDKSEGGTANCTRYALNKNKNVIQINPNLIRNDLSLQHNK